MRIDNEKKPTPLEKVNNFFYNENFFYFKREDSLNFENSGNKARKLKLFINDALKNNCDYLVTYGSPQSNHCRILTSMAKKINVPYLLILSETDDEVNYSGNYFLFDLFYSDISWTKVDKVKETIQKETDKLKQKGFSPYFIPGGGHGNLGTKAYVEAYKEIEKQKEELNINFDYIFFASGTGTTQAGLIIGNKLYERTNEKIIGISIARNEERGKQVIQDSIEDYLKEYGIDININVEDISFIDDYVGQGYGDIYPKVIETIKHVARKEAVLLDPVYTGKAFYGMLDYIEKNKIEGKNILFIHTGGLPLLFNYSEYFKK